MLSGFDHVLKNSTLSSRYRDPFNQIIIVQSICEGMKLLSADTIFDSYLLDRIW